MHVITFNDTNALGRTPLDEGSAPRRGVYLHNTKHSQETDTHSPGGIRTRNPSNRAAADPCHGPRDHQDRLFKIQSLLFAPPHVLL
jgi:hypothetical protein